MAKKRQKQNKLAGSFPIAPKSPSLELFIALRACVQEFLSVKDT